MSRIDSKVQANHLGKTPMTHKHCFEVCNTPFFVNKLKRIFIYK